MDFGVRLGSRRDRVVTAFQWHLPVSRRITEHSHPPPTPQAVALGARAASLGNSDAPMTDCFNSSCIFSASNRTASNDSVPCAKLSEAFSRRIQVLLIPNFFSGREEKNSPRWARRSRRNRDSVYSVASVVRRSFIGCGLMPRQVHANPRVAKRSIL
jgi:hypothetical protein